ncbi:MAG: curved DNA-binding protein [Cellvibrionaceae bacterium]|jgi:curved DNA-binding protein
MEFKDYYKILGVSEQATGKEIKLAYRKLARKYHPDISKEANAENMFKEVGEAYEVLKDKDKRSEYDQLRKYGGEPGGEFRPPPDWQSAPQSAEGGDHNFSDFFETIFGRRGTAQRRYQGGHQQGFSMRGEDIHLSLPLLLEELFSGEEKLIEYEVPATDDSGFISHRRKKVKLKIPTQLNPQKPMRLKGQGGAGMGDAPNGDLLIQIQLVPHPDYWLKGKDLYRKLMVMPWDAVLGCQHSIELLSGQKLKLTIPKNSRPGSKLRLKNQGIAGGDLFLEIAIDLPQRHSAKTEEYYRALAEDYAGNQ